mgnify:CR=1 FL=1
MSEYRPYQHIAKPYGCNHVTCFANVELWMDEPPETIAFGDYVYELKNKQETEEECKDNS